MVRTLNKPKQLTKFKAIIRTKHPSYNWLKTQMPTTKNRVVIRFGSTTTLQEVYPTKTAEQISKVKEINKIQSIKNSANKLLMKQCFTRADVKTADWYTATSTTNFLMHHNNGNDQILSNSKSLRELSYPIIAKHIYGSRGTGNYKLDTQADLEQWLVGKDLSKYIFEKFYNFTREYRIHCTTDGFFYTCRKMLKSESPEDKRWQRHDDNCVWILEENPSFDKPVNWNIIVDNCVKALKSTGLDIGGFDIKVQSSKDSKERKRENPEFIIIESNSACSMGEITQIKYKEALIKLINKL